MWWCLSREWAAGLSLWCLTLLQQCCTYRDYMVHGQNTEWSFPQSLCLRRSFALCLMVFPHHTVRPVRRMLSTAPCRPGEGGNDSAQLSWAAWWSGASAGLSSLWLQGWQSSSGQRSPAVPGICGCQACRPLDLHPLRSMFLPKVQYYFFCPVCVEDEVILLFLGIFLGLRQQPCGDPVSLAHIYRPILTTCALSIRTSRIQLQKKYGFFRMAASCQSNYWLQKQPFTNQWRTSRRVGLGVYITLHLIRFTRFLSTFKIKYMCEWGLVMFDLWK